MLRARLSLFALEGRENPSGSLPVADPIALPGTPSTDPVVTQPTTVTTTIINIGGAVAGAAADPAPAAPTTPTSSLGAIDPLFALPNP